MIYGIILSYDQIYCYTSNELKVLYYSLQSLNIISIVDTFCDCHRLCHKYFDLKSVAVLYVKPLFANKNTLLQQQER